MATASIYCLNFNSGKSTRSQMTFSSMIMTVLTVHGCLGKRLPCKAKQFIEPYQAKLTLKIWATKK